VIPEWVVQIGIVGVAATIIVGRRLLKKKIAAALARPGTQENPRDCYSCRHARKRKIQPPCHECLVLDDYNFTNWEAMT